jgi:hypothetical protein
MPTRRARGERGAALVEAAIMMPVVIMLVFGAIEFGFAFNEQGTVRAATRSAARSASAAPKSPTATFENAAMDTLATAMSNLVNGDPQFAILYKANAGFAPDDPGDCLTMCRVFNWNGTDFVPVGGPGWPANEREACLGSPTGTDDVGVYVEISHDWITGLPFIPGAGADITISGRTVMALEPSLQLTVA